MEIDQIDILQSDQTRINTYSSEPVWSETSHTVNHNMVSIDTLCNNTMNAVVRDTNYRLVNLGIMSPTTSRVLFKWL
jgi:hypothetical protein